MARSTTPTVAGMLRRAVAIGDRLREIHDDPNLHFLSRRAWIQHAHDLAGNADLDALQERITDRRHLLATIEQTALHWLQAHQDRPAIAHILDDPERDPGAFSERLAAGLSLAEGSALVSARFAELAPAARWGTLAKWSDLDDLIRPLRRELADLDATIAQNLLVSDLVWQRGKPTVVTGDQVVGVDENTVGRLASTLAEAAAEGLRLAA